VIIHKSAQDDYEGGGLRFDRQPIFRSERFNQTELTEINQALNISQSSSSTSTQYYQRQQLKNSFENPSSNNSDSGFGTFALIGGVLAVASLGIYGISSIVKKPKKIKK